MSNELKRKIISEAVQRLVGQLGLEDLTAIYEAEQDAWHASAQLGLSSQGIINTLEHMQRQEVAA